MSKWGIGPMLGLAALAIGVTAPAAGPEEKRPGQAKPAQKQLSLKADPGRRLGERASRQWIYAQAADASAHWIGVECYPVPPALKAQLRLESGLLVAQVLPDGPAAKVGLREHDVLLKAGDKRLDEVADLVAAIDATGEKPLKLELVRDAKPLNVEVQPTKRPEAPEAADEDLDVLRGWLERMMPGESLPPRFFILRPGTILPRGAAALPPLPEDTSVVITRRGSQPATVVVQQGPKRWELAERELDKLPAELRPHVERMVHPYAVPGLSAGSARAPGMPSAPEARKQAEKQLETHMQDVRRQIEKLQQSIDQLHRGRK